MVRDDCDLSVETERRLPQCVQFYWKLYWPLTFNGVGCSPELRPKSFKPKKQLQLEVWNTTTDCRPMKKSRPIWLCSCIQNKLTRKSCSHNTKLKGDWEQVVSVQGKSFIQRLVKRFPGLRLIFFVIVQWRRENVVTVMLTSDASVTNDFSRVTNETGPLSAIKPTRHLLLHGGDSFAFNTKTNRREKKAWKLTLTTHTRYMTNWFQ